MPRTATRVRRDPKPAYQEPEVQVGPQWMLCPQCKGLGWIVSDTSPNVMRGVKILRHAICPNCNRTGMVKKVREIGDKPVEQCPICGNWYAMGGGKPASEPCYQDHTYMGQGQSQSHCHWHDLSMSKPPS